jgi:hypothetical protein
MTKTFYIKTIMLINLFISFDARSASTVDWAAEGPRAMINTIKTAIDGHSFGDADFSGFIFNETTKGDAVKKFLMMAESYSNWKEMPLVMSETNVFSLLGRAYAESFLPTDYTKGAQYLIWGRLLELSAHASTGEAIAYAFTGEYDIPSTLTKGSPDNLIEDTITALQAALEAEAAATTAP